MEEIYALKRELTVFIDELLETNNLTELAGTKMESTKTVSYYSSPYRIHMNSHEMVDISDYLYLAIKELDHTKLSLNIDFDMEDFDVFLDTKEITPIARYEINILNNSWIHKNIGKEELKRLISDTIGSIVQ